MQFRSWNFSLKLTPSVERENVTYSKENQTKFMLYILLFVFIARISLFVASFIHFPVPIMAVIGSIFLLGWRWV